MGRIVTAENVYKGMKVVPGPEWRWIEQGMNSEYGTVYIPWYRDTVIDADGWIRVQWKDSESRSYPLTRYHDLAGSVLLEYEDEFVTAVREANEEGNQG